MFFFCKQKTAYEMRISDWSSDVCSSDLLDDRDALPIWQRQLAQRESRYWRDERAISTDVPEDWSQRPALLRALEITARRARADRTITPWLRSEDHTSELQSLMRISYAVFCLKKKTTKT